MLFQRIPCSVAILIAATFWFLSPVSAQNAAQSPRRASHPANGDKKLSSVNDEGLDLGRVSNEVYRNQSLSLSCRIPAGWVLRTEEMNSSESGASTTAPADPHEKTTSHGKGSSRMDHKPKVLLAAFSRPPEAKGEDVNSSILIAAESMASYPGLKDAAQYFGPLSEVAQAKGFARDEDPYEIEIGARIVARADFHKDVGTRVMRQSTLAILAHGYAVSITFIAGAEDEIEELIDGLSFEQQVRSQK